MENIRNFVIIAHIDSGKSTLADRFLEVTGTVPMRSMQPQYLDRLPLERERGITIKMAPVRMLWHPPSANNESSANQRIPRIASDVSLGPDFSSSFGDYYTLNLIDTPGHSDFSYEVSRALLAVEGGILLVDGTKGIQAQTLSNLRAAQKAGLVLIPAVNKIDLAATHVEKVVAATAQLLGVEEKDVFRISAKTGQGVEELLRAVVEKVPPPKSVSSPFSAGGGSAFGGQGEARRGSLSSKTGNLPSPLLGKEGDVASVSRALIFDSLYDDHKGIIANVRVFSGEFKNEEMEFIAGGVKFKPKEVGYFAPNMTVAQKIGTGDIGYIATGLKEPAMVKIGDTVLIGGVGDKRHYALHGYREPSPVVFISFYPDGATKFDDLKRGFEKLRLNDAALSFEPDSNEALGRGLKAGFLGQLHFEIIADRLKREYGCEFLTSFPSIAYRVQYNGKEFIVKQAQDFPDHPEKVWEPIVDLEILTPQQYLSPVLNLQTIFDIEILEVKNIGENLLIQTKMPLRELIRDFDDRLKSVSQGYASFTYELAGDRESEVEKLEILIVEEVIPALTRIVPKKDLEREGRQTVERLKDLLPQEQFSQAIQAKSQGRIIARETIAAMKKKLGDFGKNGGDRTRKMKLWKKQERGKERLQAGARVNLSPETFREILKK